MSGNGLDGVVGVNNLFQDASGLGGVNENGVPVRTILINNAVQTGFDQNLISRSQAVNNISENFQIIGIDSDVNRTGQVNFGFNFFRIGELTSGGLSPSNQRRAMVINGSTGELLANIQPGLGFADATVAAAENQLLIDAINSMTNEDTTPLQSGYEAWAEAEISDADLRAENADADSDGLINLFEYAYGTDPEVADAERGPRVVNADGVVTLQYQRSTTAEVVPLSLIGGASLENLTPFDSGDLEAVGAAEDDVEQVTVDLSSLGERFFLRLTTSSL